eukprot:1441481-Pleurochrysis_carterae.AAC.1
MGGGAEHDLLIDSLHRPAILFPSPASFILTAFPAAGRLQCVIATPPSRSLPFSNARWELHRRNARRS